MPKIIIKKNKDKTQTEVDKKELHKRKLLKSLAFARAESQRRKSETGYSRAAKKNPYEKWLEQKLSLRKSISAKCWECCGGELYRSRIRYCNVFGCPLWFVRPYGKHITEEQCREWKEVKFRTGEPLDKDEDTIEDDTPVPVKKIISKKIVQQKSTIKKVEENIVYPIKKKILKIKK